MPQSSQEQWDVHACSPKVTRWPPVRCGIAHARRALAIKVEAAAIKVKISPTWYRSRPWLSWWSVRRGWCQLRCRCMSAHPVNMYAAAVLSSNADTILTSTTLHRCLDKHARSATSLLLPPRTSLFRWDSLLTRRSTCFAQGAGGLIWALAREARRDAQGPLRDSSGSRNGTRTPHGRHASRLQLYHNRN